MSTRQEFNTTVLCSLLNEYPLYGQALDLHVTVSFSRN